MNNIKRKDNGKFRICIDPGHGGKDPGAVRNNLIEKDINLVQAKACKEELEKTGQVEVYMTRENDTFIEIYDRVVYGKNKECDLLISFHNNGGGGDRFEVIHSIHQDDGSVELAKYISKRVLDDKLQSVSKTLCKASKNNDKLDHFGIVRFSRQFGLVGIILEGFFVDNATDSKDFDEKNEQENYGKQIAKYVLEYLGIFTDEKVKGEQMWKRKLVEDALKLGLITDQKWLEKYDETASVWFVLAVVMQAIKLMRK